MQEMSLKVYENKKSFLAKLTNSLFRRKSSENINSSLINKKRNSAIKKYKAYLENEKKLEDLEYSYILYLEAINDYIINKVYDRVRNSDSTEYERTLLAKYYVILQLKDTEYYEYKYRKQIYL